MPPKKKKAARRRRPATVPCRRCGEERPAPAADTSLNLCPACEREAAVDLAAAYREEHRALWSEITTRLREQKVVLNMALVALTALVVLASKDGVPSHWALAAPGLAFVLTAAQLRQWQGWVMVTVYLKESLQPGLARALSGDARGALRFFPPYNWTRYVNWRGKTLPERQGGPAPGALWSVLQLSAAVGAQLAVYFLVRLLSGPATIPAEGWGFGLALAATVGAIAWLRVSARTSPPATVHVVGDGDDAQRFVARPRIHGVMLRAFWTAEYLAAAVLAAIGALWHAVAFADEDSPLLLFLWGLCVLFGALSWWLVCVFRSWQERQGLAGSPPSWGLGPTEPSPERDAQAAT